jgi:hypothetical protein
MNISALNDRLATATYCTLGGAVPFFTRPCALHHAACPQPKHENDCALKATAPDVGCRPSASSP